MILDLSNQNTPDTYMRNNRPCYLDNIRKKLIYITPEETVRQQILSFLINELAVPQDTILVEEPLVHYGINTKLRADIIIHKNDGEPLAVIECKSPDVYLSEKVFEQAANYADLLEAEYVIITNGLNVLCYAYDSDTGKYAELEYVPEYRNMISGNYEIIQPMPVPDRIQFEDIEKNLHLYQGEDIWEYDIGICTEKKKAIPLVNLWECLLDVSRKLPRNNYGLFTLIEDYGVRLLSYGNASGGHFAGPYRSFLVDVDGNTEFISISVSTYNKSTRPEIVKTNINVAIDDEKLSHHALQLTADTFMSIDGNKCIFEHDGRITAGKGSVRREYMMNYVKEHCPDLIHNSKIALGTITHDRLWYLDDNEIIEFISRLVSYAILRDKFRKEYLSGTR